MAEINDLDRAAWESPEGQRAMIKLKSREDAIAALFDERIKAGLSAVEFDRRYSEILSEFPVSNQWDYSALAQSQANKALADQKQLNDQVHSLRERLRHAEMRDRNDAKYLEGHPDTKHRIHTEGDWTDVPVWLRTRIETENLYLEMKAENPRLTVESFLEVALDLGLMTYEEKARPAILREDAVKRICTEMNKILKRTPKT